MVRKAPIIFTKEGYSEISDTFVVNFYLPCHAVAKNIISLLLPSFRLKHRNGWIYISNKLQYTFPRSWNSEYCWYLGYPKCNINSQVFSKHFLHFVDPLLFGFRRNKWVVIQWKWWIVTKQAFHIYNFNFWRQLSNLYTSKLTFGCFVCYFPRCLSTAQTKV